MKMLRVIIAFLVAVIVATIGLSAVSTHSVIANLGEMGFAPTFAEQASMYINDFAGLAPAAGGINAIGLLIGFAIAALIIRSVWNNRTIGYSLAGLVAMELEMILMGVAFDGITPIAGARTMSGLVAIGIVGILAGFIFGRMTRPKS